MIVTNTVINYKLTSHVIKKRTNNKIWLEGGRGCPLPSRLEGLGERRELLQPKTNFGVF